MTPTLYGCPLALRPASKIVPCASLSLSSIRARVISTTFGTLLCMGRTWRRTIVPGLPRINLTTSLSFMSTTSTHSPVFPSATAMTLSSSLRWPSLAAAPPGMIFFTTV